MDFEISDVNFDSLLDKTSSPKPSSGATTKPVLRLKRTRPVKVKYDNAVKLASEITLEPDCCYYAIVKGTFIFGDFLEALTSVHKLNIEKIYVTTLGMNENNVDSLINLIRLYEAPEVNLIVSSYFFGVEKRNLIPYMAEEAAGKPFNVAVAGSHAKITCIKAGDLHLVMHGSANLSSNSDIEQFMIQDNKELFDYNVSILERIMQKHTIIRGLNSETSFQNAKKSWHNHLWQEIEGE